jgi:hypothetical protein
MFSIERVGDYRKRLEKIISENAPEQVDLMVVESVRKWCEERGGINPPDPLGMAIRCVETGRAGILLRASMSAGDIQSTIDRIEFGPSCDLAPRLNSPFIYLAHLVLHELAHLRGLEQEREDDCDQWAFDRLPEDIR